MQPAHIHDHALNMQPAHIHDHALNMQPAHNHDHALNNCAAYLLASLLSTQLLPWQLCCFLAGSTASS
jgi:hypothetical protein